MIVDEECNWSTLALPSDYFLKGNLETKDKRDRLC